MALRRCPVCGSNVKLENMRRHFANVHPGQDASIAIPEEEHREIRKASRAKVPAFWSRRPFLVAVGIVAIAVGGIVGAAYLFPGGLPGTTFNVLTYCGGEGTVAHYHPLLVINHNGAQQHLPYDSSQSADIGCIDQPGYTNPSYYCAAGGFHAMHTHDGSGIIHLELPRILNPPPTLGQFFTIWGQPLSPAQVWTFSGTVTATMYDSDTHTSKDFSSNPGAIPLYEPPGGPTSNPYAIPQSLIFDGAYGTGVSGGTFSGEIIWLNITA